MFVKENKTLGVPSFTPLGYTFYGQTLSYISTFMKTVHHMVPYIKMEFLLVMFRIKSRVASMLDYYSTI
jgi:hypothetical protein